MKEITVTASFIAKLGHESELETALRAVTLATHNEPGCLKYVLHRDLANRGRFYLFERWTSVKSHDAHMQTAHVQELQKMMPPHLDAPPEVLRYEVLPVGGKKGSLDEG